MDKKESRAIIKYFHKNGIMTKGIHDDMIKTLGEDSPCYQEEVGCYGHGEN